MHTHPTTHTCAPQCPKELSLPEAQYYLDRVIEELPSHSKVLALIKVSYSGVVHTQTVLSLKTGGAQHAVEHMAHHLVLTSTTKVYDNYNLQRVVMTPHVNCVTA